jgi:minor extracellular serine protease Vpr
MKKIFFTCSLLASIYTFAQQNNTPVTDKLDAQLKLWVTDEAALRSQQPALYKAGPVADPVLSVIFKAYGGDVKGIVEKYNGKLYSSMGTIYTAEIPLSRMAAFAAEKDVVKIESSKDIELHNDRARQLTGVSKVQGWELPEEIPYTGKGVVVGVIDTGIDFLHPDFRRHDDSTKIRIVNIWDQTLNGGIQPAGFNYGSEWTQAQVNAELTNPGTITERDSSGHGTHVTGTAAGLRGMAFEAEILSVKTPLVSNGDYKFATSAKTLDAVNYMYQRSGAMGKPCVVNMSLGFNFGAPHDGSSLFEQGIDYLVSSRDGFIVCASAGNEGNSNGHNGGYALTNDSIWLYVNALNGATWYAVNEQKYDDSIWVSVTMDSAHASFTGSGIINQTQLFQTPWFRLKDIKNAAGGFSFDIVYGNGDTAANIRLVANSYDSARTELYIYPRDRFVVSTAVSPTHVNLYKISFKGSGVFHSWYQELNGLGLNVASFGAKTNARYKSGDNNYTIGIPATGKKVFAVGAYINKKDYVDILGRTQKGLNTNNLASGQLAYFSSVGPTLDGRVKPEFSAPGLNVASSHSRYGKHDSTEMTDANTIVFSGTSMSCPVTTGCFALYLEKYPHSTFEQMRAAIDSATIRDQFVKLKGPIPNNYWGYGKLDIFKAMGGQWHTGIEDEIEEVNGLVFPNPSSGKITFILPEQHSFQSISIYDLSGRMIVTIPSSQQQVDVSSWQTGMYFYRATGEGQALSGKFVVSER